MKQTDTLRLLLAGLLAFFSEIVLWYGASTRSALEWLPLLIGYVALAAILLDFAARYRVRDIFGVMLLAGIYGLVYGLILNPEMALFDVPRTWITRVMGGHTLMGLLALAFWFGLTTGFRREDATGKKSARAPQIIVLIAVMVLGAAWGAWARWSGDAAGIYHLAPDFSLEVPLLGLGFLTVIGVIWRFSMRSTADTLNFRLNPLGLAASFATLLAIGAYHGISEHIDSLSLTVLGSFIAFCWSILWFSVRKKGIVLVEGTGKSTGLPLYWLIIAVVFLLIGGIFYNLPRGENTADPISWINIIFLAFGLVWLPTIALLIGGRAVGRRARALRL